MNEFKQETLWHPYLYSVRIHLQPLKFDEPIFITTIYIGLSNHINYKIIGLVLSEIWIFKVYPRFLPLDLTRMACAVHNSPYTTSIIVKLILLESLHLGKHIKISKPNSTLVTPSNLLKLPYVMTGLTQGSSSCWNSRAHNLTST